MPRRALTIAAVLALAAPLAACGHKEKIHTEGKTEGAYLDVGPLKYQVQISRQLNPSNVEDKTFLSGLGKADRPLPNGQVWFAVFIRVENETHRSQTPASEFEIDDTLGDVYKPLHQAAVNPFAYQPRRMPAAVGGTSSLIPPIDSVASDSNIQGSLLLFKIPEPSLANRPLVLKITSPENKVGTVDLDV